MAGEELSVIKQAIDMFLEAVCSLSFPHEPELKDVGSAATLDVFVAGVVLCVIELVLLEEVLRLGGVRGGEDAGVAGEEGGALLRSRQQLVRVPGHGVRAGRRKTCYLFIVRLSTFV